MFCWFKFGFPKFYSVASISFGKKLMKINNSYLSVCHKTRTASKNEFQHVEKSDPTHFANAIPGVVDDLPQVQKMGLNLVPQGTQLAICDST